MAKAKPLESFTSFESPESRLIAHANYDPTLHLMEVTFSAGTTYVYDGIPQTLWDDFCTAASKGSFFGKMIRPMFAGRRKE